MMELQRNVPGRPWCTECSECRRTGVDIVVEINGDVEEWVRLCYPCLSKACGLLGGALLEAEEKAAEREVLETPIGEYP